MHKVVFKDTLFRDGVQGRGIEVSVLKDALRALTVVDALGVNYHEVGFAVGNVEATERIKAALELPLNGKVCAFGRTAMTDVEAILSLGVPVGVLVAKSRRSDTGSVIRVDAKANLVLIEQTVSTLVGAGVEVILDAEHYFQGFFESDRGYSLEVLECALNAGARWVVLCDTNGKMAPHQIGEAVAAARDVVPIDRLGVHTHNDRGRAIVNAEEAWRSGVTLVEGVVGGFGERTGNMDLLTFIANVSVEHPGCGLLPEQLRLLTQTYETVCEALGVPVRGDRPWVGKSAFYTEAGMHQSGLTRVADNYLHADPALVGNAAGVGVTSQSGRANLISKALEFGIDIPDDKISEIASEYQKLVDGGLSYSMADESFHLFLLQQLGTLDVPFRFGEFDVSVQKQQDRPVTATATLRMTIKGKSRLHVADGDGPVNALDEVFRRTLRDHFPEHAELLRVRLIDFNVRTVDAQRGTAAKVLVRISFTDGAKEWTMVAVHENLIEACWEALYSGYVYKFVTNGITSVSLSHAVGE